jgi:hypothetical protein
MPPRSGAFLDERLHPHTSQAACQAFIHDPSARKFAVSRVLRCACVRCSRDIRVSERVRLDDEHGMGGV